MNIKELAEQAGLEEGCVHGDWTSLNWPDVRAADLERFAELIRAEEREVCAKLCDAECNQDKTDTIRITTYEAGGYVVAEYCAKKIRSRK